jgi:hypothetical protein
VTTVVVFGLGMLAGACVLALVIAFAEMVGRSGRCGGLLDDALFRRIGRRP